MMRLWLGILQELKLHEKFIKVCSNQFSRLKYWVIWWMYMSKNAWITSYTHSICGVENKIPSLEYTLLVEGIVCKR